MTAKPDLRPARPFFSSGPCAKHPGWSTDALKTALLGRSHRSAPGMAKLRQAIAQTRDILRIPADYRVAIVPASDTGAIEMALWSLLGPREIDIFAWESFGEDWVRDTVQQLGLKAHVHRAPYGQLPTLIHARDRDVVFLWNGTTSGVRVPDGNWIADDREGLTICDATSAVFAADLPWRKLDATTFSWQKVLGGEAGHGMLILSPRAAARLESFTPPWPLPKIFRLTKDGRILEGIFEGETINTPSMLAVEDYLEALDWAARSGGLPGLMRRADANAAILTAWIDTCGWARFLAEDPAARSNTSVCLKITDPWFTALGEGGQREAVSKIAALLEAQGVGFDIAGHRAAPPGLRIWCGATVEAADLAALTPWLDWAFAQVRASLQGEA